MTYNLDSLSYIVTRLYGGTPHAPDNARGDEHDWHAEALCASIGADLWFPTVGDYRSHRLAVTYCQRCPVRQPCLEEALATPWLGGIWAGTTAKDREGIRGERGRVA